MKEKKAKLIEKVKKAEHIDEKEKSAILQKLEEWREEEEAVDDIMNRLEAWWIKIEPFFAELGLV
jgi:hypothetical protein